MANRQGERRGEEIRRAIEMGARNTVGSEELVEGRGGRQWWKELTPPTKSTPHTGRFIILFDYYNQK